MNLHEDQEFAFVGPQLARRTCNNSQQQHWLQGHAYSCMHLQQAGGSLLILYANNMRGCDPEEVRRHKQS